MPDEATNQAPVIVEVQTLIDLKTEREKQLSAISDGINICQNQLNQYIVDKIALESKIAELNALINPTQ